jgi:hypothetical protein
MQCESELFEAKCAELSRQSRRQRIARLTAPFTSAWASIIDRLTRPSREAEAQKDLLERLESMPAYMLSDIGVMRDSEGRFCHYNDFGTLVELVPSNEPDKKAPVEATGHLVRVSG